MGPRIAIITTGDKAAAIIVNAVCDAYCDTHLFLDDPEPKSAFLKRRAKKIGWFATLHQLPVMVMGKFFKRFVEKQYATIEREYDVSMVLNSNTARTAIGSANSEFCHRSIAEFAPDIVLLVGARILSKRTLAAIPCPVVNFHAGISPAYRGLNGGYWALANTDPGHFGGTVHFVDSGVDTGTIIAQHICRPAKGDTILTYQHRISGQCAPVVVSAIRQVLDGTSQTIEPGLPSKQWYHPTLTGYLWRGITKGVW